MKTMAAVFLSTRWPVPLVPHTTHIMAIRLDIDLPLTSMSRHVSASLPTMVSRRTVTVERLRQAIIEQHLLLTADAQHRRQKAEGRRRQQKVDERHHRRKGDERHRQYQACRTQLAVSPHTRVLWTRVMKMIWR